MHAPEWRVGGHVLPAYRTTATAAAPPADDRLRSLSCSLSPPSQGGDLSPLPTSPLFAVPSPASPEENRAAGRPTGLYLERHHQMVYDEGMREAADEAGALLLRTRGETAAALRMVPSSVPYGDGRGGGGGGGEPRVAAAAAGGKAKGVGYSYASSQLAYGKCEDAASRKSRALRQRQPNVCAGLPPPPRVAKHPETKNAGWVCRQAPLLLTHTHTHYRATSTLTESGGGC